MDHKTQARTRLTSNYNRRMASNVQKLIDLMMQPANVNELSYDFMLRMRDIDQATGVHLDMHGENADLKRGQMDDELYRALIKVKYLINQSNGSIPTLNRIFRAFLGDAFKGLQEGWNHVSNEPAALIVKVGEGVDLQWLEFLKQAVAGGVGLSASSNTPADVIRFVTWAHHYDVPYLLTNQFVTAAKPGRAANERITTNDHSYTFEVHYPITNTFQAE